MISFIFNVCAALITALSKIAPPTRAFDLLTVIRTEYSRVPSHYYSMLLTPLQRLIQAPAMRVALIKYQDLFIIIHIFLVLAIFFDSSFGVLVTFNLLTKYIIPTFFLNIYFFRILRHTVRWHDLDIILLVLLLEHLRQSSLFVSGGDLDCEGGGSLKLVIPAYLRLPAAPPRNGIHGDCERDYL